MAKFNKSDFGGKNKWNKGGFDRPNFKSGRPAEFKRERFGDRPKQMFSATCASCGKRFELPFRPTGERPVFCNDCFRNKGQSQGSPRPQMAQQSIQPRNDDKRLDELKSKIDSLTDKVNRLLQIMDKPAVVVAAPESKIEAPMAKAAKIAAKPKKVPAKKSAAKTKKK